MSDVIDVEFTMPIEEMSNEDLLTAMLLTNIEIVKDHIKSCNETFVFLEADKREFVIKHYKEGNRWQYLADKKIIKLTNIITQMEVNSRD